MGILTRILKQNKMKPDDKQICILLNNEKERLNGVLKNKIELIDYLVKTKKELQTNISEIQSKVEKIEKEAFELMELEDKGKAKELFVRSAGLRSEKEVLKVKLDDQNLEHSILRGKISEMNEDISEIDNITNILRYQHKVEGMKAEIGKQVERNDDLISKMRKEKVDSNGNNTDFSDPEKYAETKIANFKQKKQ